MRHQVCVCVCVCVCVGVCVHAGMLACGQSRAQRLLHLRHLQTLLSQDAALGLLMAGFSPAMAVLWLCWQG